MECRDRYFVIAVDLSVTGENPVFEAVGEHSGKAGFVCRSNY